jgi:hypothetical protein
VSLTKWFKQRWVDVSRPKEGGGYEPCGRAEGGEKKAYPKCVPAAKASSMTEGERASAVRRKRAAVKKAPSLKEPTNVSTFVKLKRAKGR